MTKRCVLLTLIAAVFLTTNPAWACMGQRVANVQTIDRFLARANLSEPDVAEVIRLRKQVVEQVARGDAARAFAAEAEAMAVMGYVFEQGRGGGCGGWIQKR